MGAIAEMFKPDKRTEVEVNELYWILKEAAKAEYLSNAINNGVPIEYLIKMNNDRENAKEIIEAMEAERKKMLVLEDEEKQKEETVHYADGESVNTEDHNNAEQGL